MSLLYLDAFVHISHSHHVMFGCGLLPEKEHSMLCGPPVLLYAEVPQTHSTQVTIRTPCRLTRYCKTRVKVKINLILFHNAPNSQWVFESRQFFYTIHQIVIVL